jgi:hypothetical protein
MIEYKIENDLSAEEFISILKASTLSERRPVNEPERIAQMLRHANLTIAARENNKLIGVARSITDFAFCTYLSDLAVDEMYQKKGNRKGIDKTNKTCNS